MKLIYSTLIILLSLSCNAQERKIQFTTIDSLHNQKKSEQIAPYLTGILEDSKGNLWFGTIAQGIAKYDGNALRYYSKQDGLPSKRVTDVVEDKAGILWFNTDRGISKYDGYVFTNFIISQNDFRANLVSQLHIDRKGQFWVGTWGGVYQFDGSEFTHFPIPYPKIDTPINQDTKDWITQIKEDQDGNLWFSRDGYGVVKYDGASFVHYLKKDGLHSNHVTEIEIDHECNIWVGMRNGVQDKLDALQQEGRGGLCKLIDHTVVSVPTVAAFQYDDIYAIHNDQLGNIWIGTRKNGVHRITGKKYKHYDIPISIMCMEEDQKGNLWLGGAGGLYKIDQHDQIMNVTTQN